MRLSLCLETFFRDRPFLERLALAKEQGFSAGSFWSWKDKDLAAVARESRRVGLAIDCFSGNRRHTLIRPKDRPGLVREVEEAMAEAERLKAPALCLLSDVLQEDGSAAPVPEALPREAKLESIVEGLALLAAKAENAGISLFLEPLNTKVDHKGCFLDSFAAALSVVRRVNHPKVRILYDVYHMAMMGEDVLGQIAGNLEWIARLDVADAPGRHEPGTGQIDYAAVARLLKAKGFGGGVGFELFPLKDSAAAARAAASLFN